MFWSQRHLENLFAEKLGRIGFRFSCLFVSLIMLQTYISFIFLYIYIIFVCVYSMNNGTNMSHIDIRLAICLFFVNPPQLNRLSLTARHHLPSRHFSGAMLSFG